MMEHRTESELANAKLKEISTEWGVDLQITAEQKVEQGWVFFWNASEFVRTNDPSDALLGNGPILVTNKGQVHVLPTAVPWEAAIAEILSQI
jgi:D-alanyl-D-alanine carboxypeptidase